MVRSCFLWLLLAQQVLHGQWEYTISTIAGAGPSVASARDVSIRPVSLATDASGNVYFSSGSRVWKLAPAGVMTLVAGGPGAGYSGDGGPATKAELSSYVCGLAPGAEGGLYIADCGNHRIRLVLPNGTITTIAGSGVEGFSGDDGPALAARFSWGFFNVTGGLAADASGNLYVVDSGNQRIRKISAGGTITTIAGTGVNGLSGDGGPATNAQLSDPVAVAVDGQDNVYIAEFGRGHRVRKVSPTGIIATLAGNGTAGHAGDGGPATSAQLSYPEAIAVDGGGNVYIADADCWPAESWCSASRIRRVSARGIITTVAGNGTRGYSGDGGPALGARMDAGWGMAADRDGNLYIADGFRVRRVSSGGVMSALAGNGNYSYSGDGGPVLAAQLFSASALAVTAGGRLYIADRGNFRVRAVTPGGIVSTAAGDGIAGFSGDSGPAIAARVGEVLGIAVERAGNLFIADTYNHRIRRVSPNGIITTVAGNGVPGYSGDTGPAVAAQLNAPAGVAVDGTGNLYIADHLNHRIRRVSPEGIISTISGDGTRAHSGDGGAARTARLSGPYGMTMDRLGNLYFTETSIVDGPTVHTVRRITPGGVIDTIAGNASLSGYSGDGGRGTNAQLSKPMGVAVDGAGNIYVADSGNHRVRRVSPEGIITTIAGTGRAGNSGDGGRAAAAQLASPMGLAVDAAGNIYVTDAGDVVRLLEPDGPAPSITGITNAASNLPGPIAPGEAVILGYTGIGPAHLTQFSMNEAGLVGTRLDRAEVAFNGIPAPLLYAWTASLAAVVPYSVSGTTAEVSLTFRGRTSVPFTVPVASASPGLFTVDSSGRGQAVAVNSSGAYNSAQNPARAGDTIVLFGTGEGQTSPEGLDGQPSGDPPRKPVLPIGVTIGGQVAQVTGAGSAPGLAPGVLRIEATVPSGIAPGNAVPVTIRVGDFASQNGVTLAVTGN